MKVCIAPMVWKRPQVFDVHVRAIELLKATFDTVEFDVFCVGSEGEVSRKRVEEKGLDNVVQTILDESEMEDKEGGKEWLTKYVKRIAYG